MNPKSSEARSRDDKPFEGMRITNSDFLNDLINRSPCPSCGKSRMYFCYTCFVPVSILEGRIPTCSVRTLTLHAFVNFDKISIGTYSQVIIYFQLPIKVDIIKHKREIDGKSTAAHGAVLAPNDVTVYTYPDVPEYSLDGKTVLLFPGAEAHTVQELFTGKQEKTYSELLLAELPAGYNVGTLMTKAFYNNNDNQIFHVHNLPIERVVVIDSTWNQSRGIYADERLQKIPTVVLQNRPSQFWRHQKGSPRWYLSTIEAIHQLLLELHVCAWGCSVGYDSELTKNCLVHKEDHHQCNPYNGQYDDLLFFFKYMYEKLHTLYKHEDLLAYKRPMS